MRPGPSQAQGNLLALQLQFTVECLLSFVVDLIRNLVIEQENIQKIVLSSDVLKRERDVTSRSNRMEIRQELMKAIEQSKIKPCPIFIWIISTPCAGGTTWSYVNLQHESARLKVEYQ